VYCNITACFVFIIVLWFELSRFPTVIMQNVWSWSWSEKFGFVHITENKGAENGKEESKG